MRAASKSIMFHSIAKASRPKATLTLTLRIDLKTRPFYFFLFLAEWEKLCDISVMRANAECLAELQTGYVIIYTIVGVICSWICNYLWGYLASKLKDEVDGMVQYNTVRCPLP